MPSAGVNLPKPSGESYQLAITRAGSVNCRITAIRPGSLRIVRLLPASAQLSNLVDLDGQGLGNPRGRKPRERAGEVSGGGVLWGFERGVAM